MGSGPFLEALPKLNPCGCIFQDLGSDAWLRTSDATVRCCYNVRLIWVLFNMRLCVCVCAVVCLNMYG